METVLLHYRQVVYPIRHCEHDPQRHIVTNRALRVPASWLPPNEPRNVLRTYTTLFKRELNREDFMAMDRKEMQQLHDPTGFQQRFFQRRIKADCPGFESDARGPRFDDAIESLVRSERDCWEITHPNGEPFDEAACRQQIAVMYADGTLDDDMEDNEDNFEGVAPFSYYFAPCGAEVVAFDPKAHFDASFTVIVHHNSF